MSTRIPFLAAATLAILPHLVAAHGPNLNPDEVVDKSIDIAETLIRKLKAKGFDAEQEDKSFAEAFEEHTKHLNLALQALQPNPPAWAIDPTLQPTPVPVTPTVEEVGSAREIPEEGQRPNRPSNTTPRTPTKATAATNRR